MPELPEVETIRRQLTSTIPWELQSFHQSKYFSKMVRRKEFELTKQQVVKIDRLAKYLIFYLEDQTSIISHLGMSGNWRISRELIEEKHIHWYWTVQSQAPESRGEILHFAYIDPRRFGHIYFLKKNSLEKFLNEKGVDVADKQFDQQLIAKRVLRYPQRPLKLALMDQKLFPGVGNYMASEICAHAKIHPEKTCAVIDAHECQLIYRAIQKVIKNQVKYQGLSFHGGYRDAFGNDGGGLSNLVVFHQKKCGFCLKTEIKKIVIGGRSTFYCPECQSM